MSAVATYQSAPFAIDETIEALSDREADLLRATYRVAARGGSHRMSLQDVADEAGVSKGLVLYHFKSKANLLSVMMRWALVRTAERVHDEIDRAGEDEDVIEALLRGIWISPQANRDFYLLYVDLVEHAAREEAFADLPATCDRIIDGLYAEVVRNAVDRGDFPPQDPVESARMMRALIEGLFVLWLQEREWQSAHETYRRRCASGLFSLLHTDS